jgi:cysteine synthase A
VKGVVLAKLDYPNPGFSKKNRAVRGIIEAAEQERALRPGQTVLELLKKHGSGARHRVPRKGHPFITVFRGATLRSALRARRIAATRKR